ncbi:glcG, partial [Symbiodinium necroappetens]
ALPDKKYWGRMKMSCENSSVDSEYVYTEDYIITPPACIWSTHTGQWGQPDQFECVDGTYCSETDPSCCVPHGGRIRCPASTPFMCHNPFDCADSQERCCKATEEECNDHGGLRTCEVPAKTPLLTQVESLGPASLTISWEPQECPRVIAAAELSEVRAYGMPAVHQIGYSSCQFLEWRVAISQVHIYGEGQWIWMRECDTRDYNKRSCTIENLRSLTDYNVRVWAQCTVVELSSYPNRTTVAVGTRPIPAVPPSALFCTGLEPLRFYADWWASDPEDCEFVAWELEAQLLPRTAGFTEDGLFEGAAPGGEYETKCVLYDRDLRECWVTDLLADRDYKIRVRETCTDPLANSEFFVRYQECATLTMPAFNPENLTHYNEDLYTFEVSWDPGDPKACIFQYWEVQVKVHVGLNSGKAFQVRMRLVPDDRKAGEACTVRRLYTDWVYYDEVVETRLPVPASMPENLTANSTSPNHDISFASLDVAWDAHPPGECIFTGWKVETRIHDRNLDWEESSECRANPREPFECQITQGLLSNVYYDMRITETCVRLSEVKVDPNALGDTLTVLDIARTRPVPAVAPFIVSVYATSARISQRAAGQCVFEAYTMEWKMQGWDYWLPYDDCTPRSTTTCSVSGFPASQSYYTVRMKESCTDPMADSPWVEWPDFVLTWPEPAQIPSNFTAVELTAYNMPGLSPSSRVLAWTVRGLLGRCKFYKEMPARQSLEQGKKSTAQHRAAMSIVPSSAVTLAGAEQAVRAGIAAAEKSGWKVAVAICDAGGNLIALHRMDGCMPIGAEIATEKARSAILFARETKLLEGAVNGEKSNGGERAALLTSGRVLMEGGVPIIDPSHGRIIGACGVSGVKPNEDAAVAKEKRSVFWCLAEIIRERLLPLENFFKAGNGVDGPVTCSVTNLQSFTVYQVRVRERCTDFIYDSDWGYSDPIMTTMPVQAGVPVDMRIVPNSITAFFFDVSWQAGASGQCIFKEWVMEVYQTSPDPEDWAFAPLPSLQDPPGVW